MVSGTTTTTTYLNDPASGAMAQRVATGSAAPVWQDYLTVDGQIVAMRSASFATASAWGTAHWGNFVWGGENALAAWDANKWGSLVWGAAPSSASWAYFTLDHLGSVAVVTDQFGGVVERASYDAWGKRRHADGSAAACYAISSATTRGFTNQEMMDSVCLVNLNARLYEATLGRFVSADPMVEDPYNLQILNRYSYVLNNPLSFTDPSGMCFLGCFWNSGTFRSVLVIAVATLLDGVILPELEGATGTMFSAGGISGLSGTQLALNAGLSGGISGAITSGRVNGALLGAFEGLAFYNVGSALEGGSQLENLLGSHDAAVFVAHGMVGGLTNSIGGGKFGSGFLAAGVGSLADTPEFDNGFEANVAEHAVLGGLGSVLGGGKFANGAETGAFGYLFNDLAHSWANQSAVGGATVGSIAVPVACDAATEGVCALGTPALVGVGATGGAAIGYAMGYAAGTVADQVTRVHGNSAASMQGTELYYLINNTTGEIDKIGVTSYPGERFSQAFLAIQNVHYETQYYYQWRAAAYVAENIELVQYQIAHGQLPRLNRVTH